MTLLRKYPGLCTVSQLLYLLVKNISPDYGVQASLMLFLLIAYAVTEYVSTKEGDFV